MHSITDINLFEKYKKKKFKNLKEKLKIFVFFWFGKIMVTSTFLLEKRIRENNRLENNTTTSLLQLLYVLFLTF